MKSHKVSGESLRIGWIRNNMKGLALIILVVMIAICSCTQNGQSEQKEEDVIHYVGEISPHFPWEDVDSCMNNKIEPRSQYAPCPKCGKASEELLWIDFCSPSWTWSSLCGRQGPLSICPDCHYQVQFICETMS